MDFSLCGRDRIVGQAAGLCDLYRRGYRVLLDKQGVTGMLPEPDGRPEPRPLPTEEEYLHAVSVFWFEAYHQAGYLAREDLWALKFRDGTMKKYLRKMLEWAAVIRDPDADVRQIGHGMRSWVDDRTWADLHGVWGGFDADSSRQALMATVEVFRRVAREVAGALGFAYPESADRQITARTGRSAAQYAPPNLVWSQVMILSGSTTTAVFLEAKRPKAASRAASSSSTGSGPTIGYLAARRR